MALTQAKESTHGLLQAQLELFHHTFSFIKSMSLKCAIDLRIPDAIHACGGAASLSDLLAALALPQTKLPHLRRLMRMLAISGIFAAHQPATVGGEAMYGLTPASRLLVGDNRSSLSAFLLLSFDRLNLVPFFDMSAWFKDEGPTSLFEMTHGQSFWDMTQRDAAFNALLNSGMAVESRFVMDIVVKDCGDIFRGIKSLVDVGGGLGAAAKAIAKAFVHVKCSVLDLPQVVAQAPTDGTVEFVTGDMFEYIPPADAVFLKTVLHDWGHDDCVKILQRCKAAIPPKEAGGKVIIIDMVVRSWPQEIMSKETQALFDISLMFIGGVEREEHEWKKIFVEAGFSEYKIIPALGIRSIIEVYP